MTDPTDTMQLPQGDIRLLRTQVAIRLLASRELARVAYVAKDGTPRVFPMFFHWTGDELVLPTFAGANKIGAMRANPAIAVTIDAASTPPEVLLLRGRVDVVETDGILPEYAAAIRRYAGEEQGDANVAALDQPVCGWHASPSGRPGWACSISNPGSQEESHKSSSSDAVRRRDSEKDGNRHTASSAADRTHRRSPLRCPSGPPISYGTPVTESFDSRTVPHGGRRQLE